MRRRVTTSTSRSTRPLAREEKARLSFPFGVLEGVVTSSHQPANFSGGDVGTRSRRYRRGTGGLKSVRRRGRPGAPDWSRTNEETSSISLRIFLVETAGSAPATGQCHCPVMLTSPRPRILVPPPGTAPGPPAFQTSALLSELKRRMLVPTPGFEPGISTFRAWRPTD